MTKLLLIASEVSEAMELVRSTPDNKDSDISNDAVDGLDHDLVDETGKVTGLPSELADIIIRTLELAGALGIDIGAAVTMKIAANRRRPYRHGLKRF